MTGAAVDRGSAGLPSLLQGVWPMGVALNACPTAHILERLLAEQLIGPERDSVESHVELGAACQEQLESLVAATSPGPAAADALRHEPELEPAEAFVSRLRELLPPRADGLSLAAVPADGR